MLHGVQVVEVGVWLRVHQDGEVAEDGEGQVEVEREDVEVKEKRLWMACGWNEDFFHFFIFLFFSFFHFLSFLNILRIF